jgi:hypothetical protein
MCEHVHALKLYIYIWTYIYIDRWSLLAPPQILLGFLHFGDSILSHAPSLPILATNRPQMAARLICVPMRNTPRVKRDLNKKTY